MKKKAKNINPFDLDWDKEDPLDYDLSDYIAKTKWRKMEFVLMPKDKTVTLRMPQAMVNQAKKVAEKKGVKYQKLLRDVIADYLSRAA